MKIQHIVALPLLVAITANGKTPESFKLAGATFTKKDCEDILNAGGTSLTYLTWHWVDSARVRLVRIAEIVAKKVPAFGKDVQAYRDSLPFYENFDEIYEIHHHLEAIEGLLMGLKPRRADTAVNIGTTPEEEWAGQSLPPDQMLIYEGVSRDKLLEKAAYFRRQIEQKSNELATKLSQPAAMKKFGLRSVAEVKRLFVYNVPSQLAALTEADKHNEKAIQAAAKADLKRTFVGFPSAFDNPLYKPWVGKYFAPVAHVSEAAVRLCQGQSLNVPYHEYEFSTEARQNDFQILRYDGSFRTNMGSDQAPKKAVPKDSDNSHGSDSEASR